MNIYIKKSYNKDYAKFSIYLYNLDKYWKTLNKC